MSHLTLSSFMRSVKGCDRELVSRAMRHPVGALEYALGRRSSFRLSVAWDYARKAVSVEGPRRPPSEDLASLASLKAFLATESERWPNWDPSGMHSVKGPLLYHVVRLLRPERVLETGVASGVSSLFVLKALSDNSKGSLISIDLPNADPGAQIPPGAKSGWIVPESLRSRWDLRIGDARVLLPEVLGQFGSIQIFMHDSLHTYDHMLWEFETAWPFIDEGGLLLSDDALSNDAFKTFCHRKGCRRHLVVGFGLAMKE